MGRKNTYRAAGYTDICGEIRNFSALGTSTREKLADGMRDSISKALSIYYSAHPDEAEALAARYKCQETVRQSDT
ncbi:MAG: hypothetical protein IKO47_08605 [Ruminococcus sp.]|nr:hypothetical protein [Ruminococcus sp.]